MRNAATLLYALTLSLAMAMPGYAQTALEGDFAKVKMETFDKEKFVFPEDMNAELINLVFLGMSNDQDNGQLQQEQLLDWHAALEERGVFNDQVKAYHFPAMNSPPFFVKGIIRGAMAESYEGKVPLNQSGVMYLDDLDEFAGSAGLTVDDQPTIVIADGDGKPLKLFKGAMTPAKVDALVVEIDRLTAI